MFGLVLWLFMLEISDRYTHSCKQMIGYKSTGISDNKSDKMIDCIQPHESTWFALEMKIYKGQTSEGKESVIMIYP